jgi:superfamily II DNA or RNA helicase
VRELDCCLWRAQNVEKAPRLVFDGVLRSSVQEEAVEKATAQLRSHGGGILSSKTGFGKTVISLNVACAMGLKTMVVVHKQFLADQWEDRIRKFVPLSRVGRLQQDVEDVDDCDIVVGMLQSIAMRDYDEDLFQGFGTVPSSRWTHT